MPSSYLIDTDTVSFALQGISTVRKRWKIAPSQQIFLSSVTVGELLYGLKKLSLTHPMSVQITGFLHSANILPWDLAAAEAYADIRHTLTLSGQLIGELDRMIAAHALARGCTLVTNNTRHFGRLFHFPCRCSLGVENSWAFSPRKTPLHACFGIPSNRENGLVPPLQLENWADSH